MKYYAKTNTGAPKAGFITRGEVLTKKQEEALGEERLRDMVRRGVLGTLDDEETERKAEEESTSVDAQNPENHAGEQGDGGRRAEDAEDETSEELPELGDTDDLISEAKEEPEPKKPAKKTAKTGGRRK